MAERPASTDRVVSDVPDEGMLAKVALALADWSERWFPDALIFAMAAVVVVAVGALALGAPPGIVMFQFGKGFWDLIPFTMQMALIIVGGYVVASSPAVARLIEWLATLPRTALRAISRSSSTARVVQKRMRVVPAGRAASCSPARMPCIASCSLSGMALINAASATRPAMRTARWPVAAT